MEELWDDYRQYLIWLCRLEKMRHYEDLFEILHDTTFTYTLERDENREGDGYALRDDYMIPAEFEVYREDFNHQRCSVFEMLIGLAIRVDREYIGDPAEPHPEKFFMEMIKNLGLDRYRYFEPNRDNIVKKLEEWMNREFSRDGRGSPFPVKHDVRDQRKLEMWDQMLSYLNKEY